MTITLGFGAQPFLNFHQMNYKFISYFFLTGFQFRFLRLKMQLIQTMMQDKVLDWGPV